VSQFAAGCAICGGDLEAHRRASSERRTAAPELPRPALTAVRGRLDDDVWAVALTALVVLFAPVIGLLVAVLVWRDPRRANVRTPLAVIGAVGLVLLFLPALRFGLFSLLWR
jgi:hypothetical protein